MDNYKKYKKFKANKKITMYINVFLMLLIILLFFVLNITIGINLYSILKLGKIIISLVYLDLFLVIILFVFIKFVKIWMD